MPGGAVEAMPAPDPVPPGSHGNGDGARAALESLAAALDPRNFATTLVTGQGRPPRLTVTSRHAALAEDVCAQDGWLWWSWGERLAPFEDAPAAAGKIATALHAYRNPPIGDRPPAPGHDEIVVAVPAGRYVCNSRAHAALGCLADVIVTFGKLGTRWHPDALWPDSWGRTYAMCAECWDSTRQVAHNHRPGLIITHHQRRPAL